MRLLRIILVQSSLAMTLACTTAHRERTTAPGRKENPPQDDGTGDGTNNQPQDDGVITGNGSGGVPDRQLATLPLEAKVKAFHSKLAKAEPTWARLVQNFIFGEEVGRPKLQYYRTVPKDGAPAKDDHDGEQCVLNEREVRAYYDAKTNSITFCRGFYWTKESNFATPTSESFQTAVIMHEYLHVLFDVIKMGYGNGEEEVVSAFDGLFLAMIDAKNPTAFKQAVLDFRAQLDRSADKLGIWSQPEEVVGVFDQVPILVSDPAIVYPVPKNFYDASYIAPHFLDYQLGKIFTTQLKIAADKLVASALVQDKDLGDKRLLTYYQVLYKGNAAANDFKMARVSLGTLNATFDYAPNSTLNARLINGVELSAAIQKFLTRAAEPDMQVAWLRVIEYKPPQGANGANDYIIFVE